MDQYLRDWREDAVRKNQHDTAIFVGDKVLALTIKPRLTLEIDGNVDASRLAHLHFENANYSRALNLLTNYDLIEYSPSCKYLAAHCHVKQNKFEEALAILGDRTPSHLVEGSHISRRKLASDRDVHSRGNSVKPGKGPSKLQTNGEHQPLPEDDDPQSTTRWEGGMAYLRGFCHAKQNAFDTAKQCYIDAVRIDVHCFEAFDALMKNSLMSPEEEWAFLESLDFDAPITQSSDSATTTSKTAPSNTDTRAQAADLLKTLYTTRLSKHKNPAQFTHAVETLATHYNLPSNPDILLSRAELLFTQCRFRSALQLTTQILQQDPDALDALPIHIAAFHELAEKNALFLLSHEVAARHPEDPRAWLAVATYYLSIGKVAEARRFFSKSSMMDPHFGPAWIGFAHTFAAEGEHDQAISAYSTAARLFQGTHLPQLFLGMQSLQNANTGLAREFLGVALSLCSTDPLVLNEMGVVLFHEEDYPRAIAHFTAALDIAENIGAEENAYIPTRINLGHAYRRYDNFVDALRCFNAVLKTGHGSRDAGVFTAKALCLLELAGLEEYRAGFEGVDKAHTVEAVGVLHEALAVNPLDAVANELLVRALEESALGDALGAVGRGIGAIEVDAGEEEEFEA
ncbi:MAG: hypothetical protein Q9159_006906, partial [Coniocarpon cinnabarinum]